MPTAPPRICARCRQPAPKGAPCSCRPPWEGSTHPGHNDNQMRRALDTYRRDHPRCQHAGCPRLADHVDHITPLAELPKGDPRRYGSGNLQSLCEPHHTQKTARDAQRGKTRAR